MTNEGLSRVIVGCFIAFVNEETFYAFRGCFVLHSVNFLIVHSLNSTSGMYMKVDQQRHEAILKLSQGQTTSKENMK
jgi:hypothetical protein